MCDVLQNDYVRNDDLKALTIDTECDHLCLLCISFPATIETEKNNIFVQIICIRFDKIKLVHGRTILLSFRSDFYDNILLILLSN